MEFSFNWKFFKHILEAMRKRGISCLRISDFNTTGLTGSHEEYNSPWCNLTKSSGASDKSGGAGGSFGIGKFAPYACSVLRTVFYSTSDTEGICAAQGVDCSISKNSFSPRSMPSLIWRRRASMGKTQALKLTEEDCENENRAGARIVASHAPRKPRVTNQLTVDSRQLWGLARSLPRTMRGATALRMASYARRAASCKKRSLRGCWP